MILHYMDTFTGRNVSKTPNSVLKMVCIVFLISVKPLAFGKTRCESQNDRIIEYSKLEVIHKDH